MINFATYRNISIVLVALFIASFHIFVSFPKSDQYSSGADEGVYYRQAKQIQINGIHGFKSVAQGYLQDKSSHIFPPPLRLLPLTLDAVALSVSDSFTSLSFLSLLCFILLCLISYYYIADIWDSDLAVIAVVLLCFSPLCGAMAKRALIDSLTCLVMAFSLFSFIACIVHKTSRHFVLFGFSLLLLQLMRETGFLVYPFYFAALLYLKYRNDLEIDIHKILLCFILPMAALGVIYQLTYGLVNAYRIYEAIYLDILTQPLEYAINYMSGPWYRYLVDFMILSPVTILLAYMYCGHYILRKAYDIRINLLLCFSFYTILVYAFLPMSVRYVSILDIVIRILAALAVLALVSAFIPNQAKKIVITAIIILILMGIDFRSFNKHFVTNNTYDPVSYNLLYAEKFVPTMAPQPPAPLSAKSSNPVSENNRNTAASFLNKSLACYREGNFQGSIDAARKALEADPDSSEAYNNICAAYNELRQWEKAIEAGEQAVKLNPANQLAKNNLAWAKQQQAISGDSGERMMAGKE